MASSLTLEQMFEAEVRRTEAALLISMFQTYSLGRLVFKSSARWHDSSRLLLFLFSAFIAVQLQQVKGAQGKGLPANPP